MFSNVKKGIKIALRCIILFSTRKKPLTPGCLSATSEDIHTNLILTMYAWGLPISYLSTKRSLSSGMTFESTSLSCTNSKSTGKSSMALSRD